MSRICPETGKIVLYLDCIECDTKGCKNMPNNDSLNIKPTETNLYVVSIEMSERCEKSHSPKDIAWFTIADKRDGSITRYTTLELFERIENDPKEKIYVSKDNGVDFLMPVWSCTGQRYIKASENGSMLDELIKTFMHKLN